MAYSAPEPAQIFVGREDQMARLRSALAEAPIVGLIGLPGVGKTSLAHVLASALARPVAYTQATSHTRPATLAAQAHLHLATEARARGRAVQGLLDRLDALRGLWLLDDVHQMHPSFRQQLLVQAARSLGRGRIIAISRERLSLDQAGIDALELHLRGLDEAQARHLWSRLDELSSARGILADALLDAQGNPLALRDAHAGLPGPHPATALVRSLPPDQRGLAGLLALLRVPVPAEALRALLPAARARRALEALERKLIVEREETGRCGIHRDLAQIVPAALDRATRRRLEPLAWRFLTTQVPALAAGLLEGGRALDLQLALEALPERLRTPALRVAHARALTHLLELPAARQALAALPRKLRGSDPSALLAQAERSLWSGDVATADQLAAPLLNRRSEGAVRVGALKVRALAWTLAGRGDKARSLLEQAALGEGATQAAGSLWLAHALTSFWDELMPEAREALRRARDHFAEAGPAAAAPTLASGLSVALALQGGQLAAGERELSDLRARLQGAVDPPVALVLRALAAGLGLERGQREQAGAEYESIAQLLADRGALPGALWAQVWAGRVELLAGRRGAGWRRLEDVRTRAEQANLACLVAMVKRSQPFDPHRLLWRRPDQDALAADATASGLRSRLAAGLQAALSGRDLRAAPLLVSDPLLATPDLAFERMLAHLAAGALARNADELEQSLGSIAAAAATCAEGKVDVALFEALALLVQKPRVVTSSTQRVASGLRDLSAHYSIVLDGPEGELRVGERTLSLRERPMLRRLLYTLAARPGQLVERATLARALWRSRYNRALHDNPIKVNVHHLRTALRNSGLSIRFERGGYRLLVPPTFVFLKPT